ncbi:MAG TPA: PEP-CTERM sorting domain-containing protein [Pirellulaceae bacterium]|nr:PEP-CTERM sorting domain-containing protein [Pirellulaceae bacterium]HMO91246.1 PEP-CTERM sorting domain-containing protein [Pirellulaceae bacterium]HMP68570.1 PEP-CTERM sorting domain-containing protein [Pirellulaceae bacterium]
MKFATLIKSLTLLLVLCQFGLFSNVSSVVYGQPVQVTATWLGGDNTWNPTGGNPHNWSSTNVPNNSSSFTYLVSIDGGNLSPSVVTLNMNPTIDGLTIDSDDALVIENNRTLNILGGGPGLQGLTNHGLIELSGTGSDTILRFNGTQTIQGNGTIRLGANSPTGDRILATTGSMITHGANHTIRGQGLILNGVGDMTNDGLIIGDQTGVLDLRPDVFINNGTLRATGTGGIELNRGVFTNNGIIEVLDGSQLKFLSGTSGTGGAVTMIGGTLTAQGTGQYFVTSGTTTFEGVTVDGPLTITNNSVLALKGGLTNDGTMTLNSTGSATRLRFTESQTLDGNGVLILGTNSATGNIVDGTNNPMITHGSDHTIRGQGLLLNLTAGLENFGTIIADSGTMTVRAGSLGLVNHGVMRAEGGTMNFLASTNENQGTFAAVNSTFSGATNAIFTNFTAAGEIAGGNWQVIDSGGGANMTFTTAPVDIHTIGTGASVQLHGANSNLSIRGKSIDLTLGTINGELVQSGGRQLTTAAGLNVHDGTLRLDGAGTLLTVSGNYDQIAGLLQITDGAVLELSGTSNLISGGTLSGDGTIIGDLTLGMGSLLTPGLSPGHLTLDGALTWVSGASILFDLGTGALDSDLITITGEWNKSGLGPWNFTFVDNDWQVGQTYDLVNFGSTNFADTDFGYTNGGGFIGTFAFNGNQLQFTLSAIPEPSSAGLVMVLGLGLAMFRRRIA